MARHFEKKATIKDIADKAKVSKSTVSRVINNSHSVNEKKRKAVLAAMKKLDFRPNQLARGLAGGRSNTIGVVTHDIGSPFYDSVARGVAIGLGETRYSPIFIDGQWNEDAEENAIHTLMERRVDGVILIGGTVAAKKLNQIREEIPLVVAGREIAEWENGCFFIDNFAGSYEATKYLIESGHTDIAFISGIKNHQDAIRRKKGYIQALVDSGIEPNEALFLEGDFRAPSGVLAAESLLNRNTRFSAIFASNDEMAIGARLYLYRRGIRVPEDVSVVGFDDQPTSAFVTPPLTTIRQPAFELGSVAAKALVHLLDDEPYDVPELSTKLVISRSCRQRWYRRRTGSRHSANYEVSAAQAFREALWRQRAGLA